MIGRAEDERVISPRWFLGRFRPILQKTETESVGALLYVLPAQNKGRSKGWINLLVKVENNLRTKPSQTPC